MIVKYIYCTSIHIYLLLGVTAFGSTYFSTSSSVAITQLVLEEVVQAGLVTRVNAQ